MNKNDSKQKFIDIWDKIAPSFGKIGPTYWDCFGNRLVELSDINEGCKVLDIGMGRGASLFPASQSVGIYGQVIGIDISREMVKETEKEIIEKSIANTKVITMDAEDLQFEEEYFDNVIGGFSIGGLLVSKNNLNGISRIVKKGGEIGFSMWGLQQDQKWLVKLTNKYLQPETKEVQCKKDEKIKLNQGEELKNILENSGFINIRIYEESPQVIYKDKDEWWQEMWCNAVRGTFEAIQSLGDDAFNSFKSDVFDGLENYKDHRGICFTMPVIYVFGEKY